MSHRSRTHGAAAFTAASLSTVVTAATLVAVTSPASAAPAHSPSSSITTAAGAVSAGAVRVGAAPAGVAATRTALARGIGATAPAVPSGAAACRFVTRGEVRGLRARPAHVTLALAGNYGSSHVRVTECTRTRAGYVASWSVAGRVGRAGFAPAGAKREGDGRSPSGVYPFGVAFGARNPGSGMGYLKLTKNSCWGSTVGSRRYNTYFRGTCGPKDETMYNDVRGAYRQGMFIRYNTNPVRQGRGSAIFMHVGTGGPTAGCVSVPLSTMTSKVRTTRPGDVIVMGVGRAVLR